MFTYEKIERQRRRDQSRLRRTLNEEIAKARDAGDETTATSLSKRLGDLNERWRQGLNHERAKSIKRLPEPVVVWR